MSDVSDVQLRKAELRAQVLARRSALPGTSASSSSAIATACSLVELTLLAEARLLMDCATAS